MSVTSDLNAFLSGEFVLSDAVKELKACRNQLCQRDAQVAQLNTFTNTLQINVNDLMDENTQLRYNIFLMSYIKLLIDRYMLENTTTVIN